MFRSKHFRLKYIAAVLKKYFEITIFFIIQKKLTIKLSFVPKKNQVKVLIRLFPLTYQYFRLEICQILQKSH